MLNWDQRIEKESHAATFHWICTARPFSQTSVTQWNRIFKYICVLQVSLYFVLQTLRKAETTREKVDRQQWLIMGENSLFNFTEVWLTNAHSHLPDTSRVIHQMGSVRPFTCCTSLDISTVYSVFQLRCRFFSLSGKIQILITVVGENLGFSTLQKQNEEMYCIWEDEATMLLKVQPMSNAMVLIC